MKILLINLIALSFIITACSNKNNLRDTDYDLEFEKGKTALSKKKFVKAQTHFNSVVIGASHTELGDDALFFLGESHFYAKKEELLAIAEYDRLIRRMPFSPYVERARYRICEAYVRMSPKYFRDQTYSEKALEKLQEYIDDYPSSDNRLKAQEEILVLREKLSNKAYNSGLLYMKMEEYSAAMLGFKKVIKNYYDTDFIELAHMKIIACHIYKDEFEEAKLYYDLKREHIEKIEMDDLVDAWFVQKRVLDRLELD
ncbi:MAG: outer membrane protein assembly factor BamD [Fidelibacterota bacterium]|jgi:outer membrane protein assembly factor BamD|nr:outer membrane protein assembly factor BamD [Candidatus Neomarinimicrobiota bacterium]MDB9884818.1 outer membrane protein assembly factor BamD [Candidatus Neomarinimicrobiota bacterium]|tara:strand:- start:1090 stop:1857 length:768 start_codon:yes stop_codon:yes gene_type:complete